MSSSTLTDWDQREPSSVRLTTPRQIGLYTRPTTGLPTGLHWVFLGEKRLSDGQWVGVWVAQPTVVAHWLDEP